MDISAVLAAEDRKAGLRLVEVDDHFIWLVDKDCRVLAVFSQEGATEESIREEAKEWRKEKAHTSAQM